jgi:predicted Kef-type K+ transport protein
MQPAYIDAIWLSVAFICGIGARRLKLPPLIGFLVAGFILNLSGLTSGHISEIMHILSDLGVMLLLFTIGLKINIRSLIKREIWLTAGSHMVISVLATAAVIFLLGFAGLRLFSNLDIRAAMLIGFALSFSSTVFVVKVLEERGELNSYHGRLSIGILVIQDLLAVVFLTLSKGEWPSIWVLSLPIYLYLIRFVLCKILDYVDHGELLTIFGMFAAFIAGALSFQVVGLKPDLGALVIGMLLVEHKRSKELYERMMGYKDFFLIAFFVNIGLSGIPGWNHVAAAAILILLVNFKGALFLILLSRFKIKARTAFLTSLTLGNYSEFALIIGVVGVSLGVITGDWIMIMAVAMAMSFLISSPVNKYVHTIFDNLKPIIMRLNRDIDCVDQEPYYLGDANYLIVGMGEIGLSAYKYLKEERGLNVLGIDYDHDLIERIKRLGINATWGDATDSNLWDNADISKIEMVLFAMDDHPSNINSIKEIQRIRPGSFKVGVISHFPDELEDFRKLNVDYIYDYRNRLGREFAEGVEEMI